MSEKIKIEYAPLSEIEGWPRNPKLHDDTGIKLSILEHGFNDPPALDERSGRLVEGHGRVVSLRAMKDAGENPPDRVVVRKKDGEWMVPVIRGISFDTDEQAQAYLIAHNRLTEKGGWDEKELQLMLQEIMEESEIMLRATGYSPQELDELTSTVLSASMLGDVDGVGVADPRAEWEGMPEFHQDDKSEFRNVIVKFKDQAAIDQFVEVTGVLITEKTRYVWYPELEIERYADKRYTTDGEVPAEEAPDEP